MDYLESYYKDANDDIKKANGKIAGKGKKKKKINKIKNILKN